MRHTNTLNKIDMISPETVSLIDTFKEPILKFVGDLKDEVKYFLDDGLSEYVDNYKNKYSKTKTFLFREERVNFYDIYFPISIRGSKTRLDNFRQIEELFLERQYVSIIGNAGSGKSMLLKHIFLSSIRDLYRIPIIVELRNLNDFKGSITEYIYKSLFRNNLAPNSKILERLLKTGNFLFLLDGYDEIYSEQKNKISIDIEDFVDEYSKNTFIITSRPGANVEALQRFDNFQVEPLSQRQIKEFVQLQLRVSENQEAIQRIMTVIEKPDNKDYKAFLSSPLLLSMFIFTFNSYPELPRSKSRFYWNVFDTLCSKHDSFTKKGCWQHERKSELQNEDLENILKWFSYVSIFKGKYTFDGQYLKETLGEIKSKLNFNCEINDLIYDISVALSIIIIDGTEFTFPHKSLQEYFSALLIKDLSIDQKAKVYTERFNSLQRYSHGGNQNFFNLCFELDKLAFSEHFILYNLKNIYGSIDHTNKESSIYSFFKLLGFSQGFSYNKEQNLYEFRASSYTTKYNELLNYLVPSVFQNLRLDRYNGIDDSSIQTIIDIGIAKKNRDEPQFKDVYWIDYSVNWCKELYDFITNIGLTDNLYRSIEEIKLLIEKTEEEIIMERKNMQSLIDL